MCFNFLYNACIGFLANTPIGMGKLNFVHIPDVCPGTKFHVELSSKPSSVLLKRGFTDTNCLESIQDSCSIHGGSVLTNKAVLELFFTAAEFEKSGVTVSCGDNVHNVPYRIVCDWLFHFAGIVRTPKATNAKLAQLQKQLSKLSKTFNARCAVTPATSLQKFLECTFEWQTDHRRIASSSTSTTEDGARDRSQTLSTSDDSGAAHTQDHIAVSVCAGDAVSVCAGDAVSMHAVSSINTCTSDSDSIAVSSLATPDSLRSGTTRLELTRTQLLIDKQTLNRNLQREKVKSGRLKRENEELNEMIGQRVKDVWKENRELTNKVESLMDNSRALKKKQKVMLDRSIHNKIVSSVQKENSELKKNIGEVTLENETLEIENTVLTEKLTNAKKQNNKLRMRATRGKESVTKLRKEVDDAKNEYRTDKEATELYHSAIVEMLRSQVTDGEKTHENLREQLDDLATLETKDNGIYKSSIRLMYYDLLTQGVSANTIQTVVKTVLANTTQIDVESLHLPSRTTAQRMVSEAGELVKVRAAYALAATDGTLGHHSDGTTKSLIHWGAHVIKLAVNDDSEAYTLCVSPVESGKSVDTVQQLKESLTEMKDLADMLNLDYSEGAYDITRIGVRMSDRAPNEQCVTKLIQNEKQDILEQSETWKELTPEEQMEKIRVRHWTCAAHKVDNITNAMSNAAQEFLNKESDKRKMHGAKKLIYETNKLICQHSKKEYSKGKDFMMFAMDDGVYQDSATALLKPIVGNRYIIFLLNSIPTLVARDMIVVYLESLRDSKDKVGLNKLESSVLQGYMDPTVQAELAAFAIIFYHVCHPLLIKAKGAKSPLEMNWFYRTAVRKLGQYADDPSDLLDGSALLWPGADNQTEYTPMMPNVYRAADKHHDTVLDLLKKMADAGKQKLSAHASEHLPGGMYSEPTTADHAAADLLKTATNDRIESCFGMLDRHQMLCPVRNPINTSALVTARRDKPTQFVRQQEKDVREAILSAARKSATKKRKEKGTKTKQMMDIWLRGKEERDEKIRKRREKRRVKNQKFDAAVADLKAGHLVLRDTDVKSLKGPVLIKQFKLWSVLQSTGVKISMSEQLKGVNGLKVAEKRERLKTLVLANKHIDLTKLDLQVGDRDLSDTEEVSEDVPCADADDGIDSSSDEEVEDMAISHLALKKFQTAGGWVAVAFAGGVWYPGQIMEVKSDGVAVVEYLHPSSPKIPYPADTLFKKPNQADIMDTDSDSVFLWDFTLDPISSSFRQFRSSVNVSVINRKYTSFAVEFDIPQ